MLLLDARHGFKKADIEFLGLLYDPKGPSPLGETPFQCRGHELLEREETISLRKYLHFKTIVL